MKIQKVKNSKVRGSLQRNRQNKVHANIPYVQSENSDKLLTFVNSIRAVSSYRISKWSLCNWWGLSYKNEFSR